MADVWFRKVPPVVWAAVPVLLVGLAGWFWRAGSVVAEAEFDPGIAPFDVSVRKVPVPVTGSSHFIIELSRGQYVVTSHRAFFQNHTPERVSIDWDCIQTFQVRFDDDYVVQCDWEWGVGARWTTTMLESAPVSPGLSAYYFTPRNDLPNGCSEPEPSLSR